MDLKFFYTCSSLVFLLVGGGNYIGGIDGKPTVTELGYVDAIGQEYIVPYQHPITDYHLSRLRRGYYYVENGYITAIPESVINGNRRADTGTTSTVNEAKNKRTHGKRKKLFVPNLFG
ncbi:uncharacterized protein LOC129244224 [Anastrepha obliqua]|uniref:uncharacterized protein LOC129244224 n=1 Tax=Anastrepha obliqua TaxID=95512 RepID=UPI00240908C6|nr:uncharacterized protein LOC129244224 [Anastrepha obliqua]